MGRTILYGALLVGIGVAVGAWVGSRGQTTGVSALARQGAGSAALPSRVSDAATAESIADAAAELARQVERLKATLAAEANERQRLEERVEEVASELAALRPGSDASGGAASASAAPALPAAGDAATSAAPEPAAADDGVSATERALLAAGVDAATATDIKRRGDELTLSELYLRDQAAREGWLNTPRFKTEMGEIQSQRTSVRDDIGDDAYDRYLAALGEPNRVSVADVMADSVAAEAGLLSGDIVLRYGSARIFSPDELVAETRGGNAGETVRVEILRNGQRLEIDVPRGPLGLRIAASRGTPDGT